MEKDIECFLDNNPTLFNNYHINKVGKLWVQYEIYKNVTLFNNIDIFIFTEIVYNIITQKFGN